MFLPDSLHMIPSWNLDKASTVCVGFKSVSQDWKCINLFRGACKCCIHHTSNDFFQIDWVEWNDQLRQTIFVIFQHSSGFSFKQLPKKRQGNDLLQVIRKYMLHIQHLSLTFPSPNLFGSYSLSGIIKIPYSRFDFSGDVFFLFQLFFFKPRLHPSYCDSLHRFSPWEAASHLSRPPFKPRLWFGYGASQTLWTKFHSVVFVFVTSPIP